MRAWPPTHWVGRLNALSMKSRTRLRPVLVAQAPLVPETRFQALVPSRPLGRYNKPADIAAAVTFLASSAARQVTGVVLNVDGGLST
jgi:NAD(P)-dependent dehydrogenase (short-subunit alcohol dehydrogenase family)